MNVSGQDIYLRRGTSVFESGGNCRPPLTQASAPVTPHLSVAPLRPGVVNTMSTELAQTPAW